MFAFHHTVQETMRRFKNHHTLTSLQRSGRPKLLITQKERRLFCAARKYPKIIYTDLVVEAGLSSDPITPNPEESTPTKPPSRSTIYRCLQAKNSRWPRNGHITAATSRHPLSTRPSSLSNVAIYFQNSLFPEVSLGEI